MEKKIEKIKYRDSFNGKVFSITSFTDYTVKCSCKSMFCNHINDVRENSWRYEIISARRYI